MAFSHEAAPTAAPRRRRPRGRIQSPDRVLGLDMRTHEGRQYRRAFRAALEEFPGCEASRIAQVVRLRLLAAQGEADALRGRGTADAAIRLANVAVRAAHALHVTAKGKQPDGSSALLAYLAELNASQRDEDADEDDTVETTKRDGLESAPASEHVEADLDIDPLVGAVEP
jgi:hypothetical protein